jgi:hypothetical protein
MPRIRSIKPSFFRSDDVAVLPYRARLTWIGLWTFADDAGRMKDDVRIIKGDIWPLDKVSATDIEDDLAILAIRGRIVRYEVDSKRYLEIVNFTIHQYIAKPTKSQIPSPKDGSIIPFVDLPDSSSTPTGVLQEASGSPTEGKGIGVGSGSGYGGDARARAIGPPPGYDSPTSEPPPIRCPDHIKSLSDDPCRACKTARLAHEQWQADRAAAASAAQSTVARERAEAVRAEIDACDACDHTGYVNAKLCHHDPSNAERAHSGRALVDAVLKGTSA